MKLFTDPSVRNDLNGALVVTVDCGHPLIKLQLVQDLLRPHQIIHTIARCHQLRCARVRSNTSQLLAFPHPCTAVQLQHISCV